MEMTEIMRWFKKGWLMILASTIINILAVALLKITPLATLVNNAIANPAGTLTLIIGTAFMTLLFGLVLYPTIVGWLIEEIERRRIK